MTQSPGREAVAVAGDSIVAVGSDAEIGSAGDARHEDHRPARPHAHARLRGGAHSSLHGLVHDLGRRPSAPDGARGSGRDRALCEGASDRPNPRLRLARRHVPAGGADARDARCGAAQSASASSSRSTDTACGPTARRWRSPGSAPTRPIRSLTSAISCATRTAGRPDTFSRSRRCFRSSTRSTRSRATR